MVLLHNLLVDRHATGRVIVNVDVVELDLLLVSRRGVDVVKVYTLVSQSVTCLAQILHFSGTVDVLFSSYKVASEAAGTPFA